MAVGSLNERVCQILNLLPFVHLHMIILTIAILISLMILLYRWFILVSSCDFPFWEGLRFYILVFKVFYIYSDFKVFCSCYFTVSVIK